MDNWFLIYKNINVGQTPNVQKVFKSKLIDFDRIIEIGTHAGGFTLFLHDNMKESCDLISYDINPHFNKVPKEYNIDFRIGDCFSEKNINEIKDLILKTERRVLLFCDGGDKVREFSFFSQFLKSNDVIMCHDYADNVEDFAKIKANLGWMSISESSYSEISDAVQKNNLSKYHYDEFKSVLLGSFIKNN